MVLIGVLQVRVLFLERFEVGTGALQLLLKPLHAVFKLLDVLSLIKRPILHRVARGDGGTLVAAPHGCGAIRGGWPHALTNFSRPADLLADLLEDLVGEVRGHFVLED